MTIKTEILNNLVTFISKEFRELKVVERGLNSLENKKLSLPACFINSTRTIINNELTTYNRPVKSLFVYIDIVDQNRTEYFERLDDIESKMFSFVEKLDSEKKLHLQVLTVNIDEIIELINDEDLDGLYVLRFVIIINYYDKYC